MGAGKSTVTCPPSPKEELTEPSPKEELTDTPWRKYEGVFSKEFEKELKEQMESKFTIEQVKRANILLLGPITAGKSSFLNSVASICKDRIAKIVRSGEAAHSLTKKYGKFAPTKGMMKNFCLLDSMGVEHEEQGFNVDDICFMVNGNVPFNYEFNPISPIKKEDPRFKHNPGAADRVHCVVVVVDATALGDDIPQERQKRIHDLKSRLDALDIQVIVVLTKIDRLCAKVDEDIANVYRSVKVRQMVRVASETFGLPQNQVFPVKNYSDETTLDFKVNIPILLALRMMITIADDYFENHKDENEDKD